ncbi:BofC C-terminal domain-containing protein [Paenibacillus sp. sptzw28]|uniref:BofC C-terminal domain-containing protein n=1 Tax=Paenibacillus sp. sptzw28 TaxID=715179 RepID=UPI001C6EBC62|nr:BofC C-terminal domain-containing protein [Paenibacillus sp. sptzw28]QYR23400.1 BofC C-terminal domain-containing protein [Paenibacillus sp. sptzw28]
MMEFSLWKQLKKRLRRGRRPLWTLGCLLGLLALLAEPAAVNAKLMVSSTSHILLSSKEGHAGADVHSPERNKGSVIQVLASHKGPITVKLHRIYLCGDETKRLGRMDAKSVLGLLKRHSDWTAVMDQAGAVIMEQRIQDLSDACKENAYMSLDKAGNLSLFEGPPKKEKVLRTFFQLDVNYMESSLPKERFNELVNGIRISDIDDYNSVLSSFSDFAVDKSEKVMKPTY